jgi:hypothetical protein
MPSPQTLSAKKKPEPARTVYVLKTAAGDTVVTADTLTVTVKY